MNIFAIYLTVDLGSNNDWFEGIRKGYSQTNEIHITLKKPCYIEEVQIPEVIDIFSDFFRKEKLTSLDFVLEDPYFDDGCLMFTVKKLEIVFFQQKLISELKGYRYIKPELEVYEKNFKPHVTLVKGIDENTANDIINRIPSKQIAGSIQRAVLVFDDIDKGKKDPEQRITIELAESKSNL